MFILMIATIPPSVIFLLAKSFYAFLSVSGYLENPRICSSENFAVFTKKFVEKNDFANL